MKSIAALIDHTPVSDTVIEFTENIALHQGAKVKLLTIVDRKSAAEIDEFRANLKAYSDRLTSAGLEVEYFMEEGTFFNLIEQSVDKLHVSLVVIGTHGKKGLKQAIFGSHILKLVQMLNVPSLVVQESSEWHAGGFDKVLFPISSHSNFELKINQTRALLSESAHIDLYAIYKTSKLDEETKKNIENCMEYFNKESVAYSLIEEDAQFFSLGYARQTLAFASANPVHLISIMAESSGDTKVFSKVDKENVILNEDCIPVLCCND